MLLLRIGAISVLAFGAFFGYRSTASDGTVFQEAGDVLLNAGFSESEIQLINENKVVARALSGLASTESRVLAGALFHVPKDLLAVRFRTVSENAFYRYAGAFSRTPRADDLAALTLAPEDLQDLEKCVEEECDFRLPDVWLDRLRVETDLSRADRRVQLTALVRKMSFHQLSEYLADRKTAAARLFFSSSELLFRDVPELYAYLRDYPRRRLKGATDLLYWSREEVGNMPLLRLSHLTLYTHRENAGTIISINGIYASRYISDSVAVIHLVESRNPGQIPSTYLIYQDRQQLDTAAGDLSWMDRNLIRGQFANSVRRNLEVNKRKIEGEYAALPRMTK
jgi:hypothetical protein